MKKPYVLVALLLTAATQLLFFQNCAKMSFSKQSSEGIQGDPVFPPGNCTPTLDKEEGVVKIMFMIDTSGSNATNPGTDINKVWRLAVLNNFLTHYAAKANFYYNISYFKGSVANSITREGGSPGFSNDSALVHQNVDSFTQVSDSDGTPYRSALNLAKSTIVHDLSLHDSTDPLLRPKYVVVFLSDGLPDGYTGIGNNAGNGDPAQGLADLTDDVINVLSPAPDRINLNTVYYYRTTENPSAETVLSVMAQAGGGAALIANTGDLPLIDDLVTVPHGCD
jgi:hypothetical protein